MASLHGRLAFFKISNAFALVMASVFGTNATNHWRAAIGVTFKKKDEGGAVTANMTFPKHKI